MRIDWIKHGIDISKASGNKTFCPKCHGVRKDKRDKSLSFDKTTGLFNCHYPQCGFKGSAMEKDDQLLATELKPKVYTVPKPRPPQKVSDGVLEWFRNRGIDNNTLLKFQVTECQSWMPGCTNGQTVTVVCFNYYRGEKLINVKYRSEDKRFMLEKGAELILYNLNATSLGKEIVIVEGEMDALSLWQSGVCNVVSVPNGASKGNAKLEYLDNCWKDLEHLEKIILAVDDDEAGRSLKAELARRLGPERCWEINYPEACKDANEVLLRYGRDSIKRMIEEATILPLEGVARVNDEIKDIVDIYAHGHPHGPKLGWTVDEYVRFRTGLLVIITGTPGSGKSTWLNNVLIRLASLHKWPVAMFTPEKTPVAHLITELLSIHNGMPIYRADPGLKMTQDQLRGSMAFLEEYFFFLRVGEFDMRVDGVLAKATECVKRFGIKAFVIDPWNYLEHQREKHVTETEHISISLSKITTFAKKFDVLVFLIAHPAKPSADQLKMQKPGTLYSISGSANFYNKADVGITIFRNKADVCTEIHVQKVRWWWDGKEGMARQFYELKSQRFLDTPPAVPWTPIRTDLASQWTDDEES